MREREKERDRHRVGEATEDEKRSPSTAVVKDARKS